MVPATWGVCATTSQLRKRCGRDYESRRDDVLRFLIDERCALGEVSELGTVLTADEREEAFQEAKQASFQTESVFKVLKIVPARSQALAEACGEIRPRLTAERQKEAGQAFERASRAKWKPRTACRTGFVVDLCAGTPERDSGGYVTAVACQLSA